MTEAHPHTSCPRCGTNGREVQPLTVRSLLREDARSRSGDAEGFRFCRNAACPVVYFNGSKDAQFVASDLRVPVFQKSTDPDRFVCYCFEHAVRSVQEEVARTGTSEVPDEIAEKCRQGLDRCEEMNPQGVCCIGNVRQVMNAAANTSPAETARHEDPVAHDCCAPIGAEAEPPRHASAQDTGEASAHDCCAPAEGRASSTVDDDARGRNVQLWSMSGAVVAAALSSACCWLPLVLLGTGASALGLAGFLETYRTWFLVGTVGLLAAGFYLVYVKKPACAPGDACAVPNPKLQRLNKIMLWVVTVFVVAFAAFPSYVGALLGATPQPAIAEASKAGVQTYAIEGMSCASCTPHLEKEIAKVKGVAAVHVSYAEKEARVQVEPGAHVSDADIIRAVESAGYKVAHRRADG